MYTVCAYHRHFLPHSTLFRFASLCGENREVALHVAYTAGSGGGGGGDSGAGSGGGGGGRGVPDSRMWRYQHFRTGDELRAVAQRREIVRLELGACYNVSPQWLHSLALPARAETRDLVFDIDIDDYDDDNNDGAGAGTDATRRHSALARRCCTGAALCRRCWPLLACAAELLDTVLRDYLGYAHVLYAFSGRRGLHVWVCDAQARTLGEGGRAVALRVLSACAQRLAQCRSADADAGSSAGVRDEDAELYAIMRRHCVEYAQRQMGSGGVGGVGIGGSGDDVMARAARDEPLAPALVAHAMAPRLDRAVTTQLAHLLRAPLVAHQSGGIALPMPLAELLAFDPGAHALDARAVVDNVNGARARLAAAAEHVRAFCERVEDARHARN